MGGTTPISHPVLRRLGRRNIHTFLKEREQYLTEIEDAKASGVSISPISVKASTDRDLLLSLIDFETFSNVSHLEELTDDILLRYLQEKGEPVLSSINAEQLADLVRKSLRINMTEPDPEMRVQMLFMDYRTFLRSRKWDDLITDNPKLTIQHICSLLRPPELENTIQNELSVARSNLRTDWKGFYKHVLRTAVECERFHPISGISGHVPRAEDRHSGTNEDLKQMKKKNLLAPQEPFSTSPKGAENVNTGFGDKAGKHKPNKQSKDTSVGALECLNTKCKGPHKLKDCRTTSPDEKKSIWEKVQQEWASKKKLRLLTAKSGSLKGTGRFHGKLADQVPVIVNGDYGADHSALSQLHLQACQKAGIYVQTLPLTEPVCVGLAIDSSTSGNTTEYKSRQKVRLSTTIDTLAGPLRFRNVEFLVFEEPMAEVLLSRPVLLSIGFDLEKHLADVRGQFHDADLSNVGFYPGELTNASRLARLMASPLTEMDQDDSETSLQWDERTMSPGYEVETDTDEAILKMLQEAFNNGLPAELQDQLRKLVWKFRHIFRLKLGGDPPASLPPMKVKLKENASAVRVKARRYSPEQAKFLRDKILEYERLGLVRKNNTSEWACAPLIVPKTGPEKFRFTVDLRPVNVQTIPHAWPMPNLETVTAQMVGDVCFASIDLCQGYWQLPLETHSQELHSFITPTGVYSPTRVMHGATNSVSYFQSTLQEAMEDLQDVLLQWIDDMLLHCPTADSMMLTLGKFFQICEDKGLKLHAKKCSLYLTKVKWCGRIISGEGMRLDPARLQGLLEMPYPVTGGELQQFLCAVNWMRSTIPEYTTLSAPLAEFLEQIYSRAGKRTKRAVGRVKLVDLGWGKDLNDSFQALKDALERAVTLAHPAPEKVLCLFTDASESHWSSVLTQIPKEDGDLEVAKQNHEPLSFISGSFKGSSYRWSTPEKEAFAIVESVSRLDYLLLRPEGFRLYTDHKNLTFLFNPLSTSPTISRHVLGKVHRWAMRLAAFRYTIMHIAGEDNYWADLLSRWGAGSTNQPQKDLRLASLFKAPVCADLDPDFCWPKARDVRQAQDAAADGPSAISNGVRVTSDDRIWIPDDATSLQLRLCVIAHCGRGGHRGADTTLKQLQQYFLWSTMRNDVDSFCRSCLHCRSTVGGKRIPRPMGHALHADKPNELIHFDYLYMGPSDSGHIYVLIIKDDATSFVWLEPTLAADADTTVDCLMRWFACFGVVLTWSSDRGTHFKNALMSELNRNLHAHHHFTTPYCPQSNGSVEIVCREVLRACRAILSEFRLKTNEWPTVTRLLQSILNNSLRASLGHRAPLTAFTGLPADSPLRTLILPEPIRAESPSFIRLQKITNVDRMVGALDKMHREIAEIRGRKRHAAVRAHNQKTFVHAVNFGVGDYVLVAQRKKQHRNKLQVQWSGPQRILRALSDFVFEVQDLITQKSAEVHATRLKFYADSSLDVTETLLDTVAHNDPHYNIVEKLLDLRYSSEKNIFEVQVQWKGFDYEEPTWEPFSSMQEDIPDMLKNFLGTFADQNLVQSALTE